jgi:AcrR family transcriptional regulator
MSIPIGLPVLGGILLPMSDPLNPSQKAIREAAEEARREAAAAVTEIRLELRGAGRETRTALRDAMAEVREAMRGVLRETVPNGPAMPVSTRLTRAERKELTRELLLDAAIEVFAQRGYHGASLEDVAATAGFTKGAVYSNFETKGDLFMALLVRETARRNAALAASIASEPMDELPKVAGRWLERQAGEHRDWDVLTVEFWLAAARDPEIADQLRAGRRDIIDKLGGIVDARLAEPGSQTGFDGREIVVLLDALGTGLLMSSILEPEVVRSELFSRAVGKLLAPMTDDPHDSGVRADGADQAAL